MSVVEVNSGVIPKKEIEEFLLLKRPLIDVRAPCEFQEGSLPHSVNLPIMTNEERAEVGTLYKKRGREAAIELGHALVSGAKKSERIKAWSEFFRSNPNAALTCFRGGLRSQIAQKWLAEVGVSIPLLEGGYKNGRGVCLEGIKRFCSQKKLVVISGATGNGKTHLLENLKPHRFVVDLEGHAHHRGSAFGKRKKAQPTQIDFENRVALDLFRSFRSSDEREVLIEDESRLVGRCVIPNSLFDLLRNSPVVIVDESIESRTELTFQDYILESDLTSTNEEEARAMVESYLESLQKISKKLGGDRALKVKKQILEAWEAQKAGKGYDAHRTWVRFLLENYYDPLYFGSLERRAPKILFKGSREACFQFLLNR